MPRLKWLPLAALVVPSAALAHNGSHYGPPGPPGWTFDAGVTVPLGLALLAYLAGFVRLYRRAGQGRSALRRSVSFYLAGWLVLALSLVSPLHAGGEQSFTLHMIEHELIMLPAALLLVLARPIGVMLWALPRPARLALGTAGHSSWIAAPWRRITAPVAATALQAIAMWAWHAPPLFNRALGQPGWHIGQHLSFLVTALLFWWAMLRMPNHGLAALCLFATSAIGGALGALMALSTSPWYAGYAEMGMMPFGLTAIEDQELAGLIMWIPGGLVHAGGAILLLWRYLAQTAPRSSPSG